MRTFNEYMSSQRSHPGFVHVGQKPLISLIVGRPGLGYVFDKPFYDKFGASDTRELRLKFIGNVDIPFTPMAKSMAERGNEQIGQFMATIARGQGDIHPELFDSPEKLVSFDHAEFHGLDSDVEPIPDSLFESLHEAFWQIVRSGQFTVVR